MAISAWTASRSIKDGSDIKLRRAVALVTAAAILASAATALAEGIVTDKVSYQPGETVTISGDGWRPQESVSLMLGNTSGSGSQLKFDVTATALGTFTNKDFVTEGGWTGQILTLTARGTSGGEAMMAFRNGAAPGSLNCSGLSTYDPAHYALSPGQKAVCTIEAASDLSTAQQRGVVPVEVMVRSEALGNETATVLSVSGSTITFEYTAPAAAAGSATVSYGPIKGCDPLSGKCATLPTPGNDANSMLLSVSSFPAGFVYLAEGAAPGLLPNLKVVTTPQNGAFSEGAAISYTVVVSNPAAVGSGSASNVMLTDELPGYGGLLWQTVTTTQGNCSLADNRVNCSLGDIQGQGSVTVKVTSTVTTPPAACQYQPNAKTRATADGGLTMTASGALTCTPLPQLRVEKTPDNALFTQGGQAAFTISVSNPAASGAGPAKNVVLQDQLPGNGGLTWTSASASQGYCVITNNYLSCNLGDIAAGAGVTATVASGAVTPLAACQAQGSAAVATADGGLRAEDYGSLLCSPPLPAQLSVLETPVNGTFTQGGQASYTIVVTNPAPAGAAAATNVKLRDPLPINGGLSWSAASTTQGACWFNGIASNILNCGLGSLMPGSSATITVTTPATTPVTACTSQPKPAAVATADGNLIVESQGSLNCTPTIATQLKVEKSPDGGTFSAGGDLIFTYLVSNISAIGAAPATNVQLADQLPDVGGLIWTEAASDNGACSITNNRLSCTLGTIPTGGTVKVAVWIYPVPLTACTMVTSTALVTADGGVTAQDSGEASCANAGGSNAGTGGDVTVPAGSVACVGAACLSLAKTANTAAPKPGEQVIYSYIVTNTGSVTLQNIAVTDDNGTPANPADDILIGTIASLPAGRSTSFTRAVTPASSSILARLGSIGANDAALFSLGGDTGHPDAGINCSNGTVEGNVVIAGYGKFDNAAPCVETGKLLRSANVTSRGPGHLLKGVTTDDRLVETLVTDALNAAQYFAGLQVTESVQAKFPAGGNIDGSLTITGAPGFNVVNLAGLTVRGNLKLEGPAGTQFVLNISGDFDLHSGSITTGGGVGPSDVIYNITNPNATVTMMERTTTDGIVLAPYNMINPIHSAIIHGRIIGGRNRVITFISHIVAPESTPQPNANGTATASNGTVTVTTTTTIPIPLPPPVEPPPIDSRPA